MDKLSLLRGEPYKITDRVMVRNPSLGEICEFGENKYWGTLTGLCATSFDYILDLHEAGVDYLEISDWEMFINIHRGFDYERTKLVIPGVDFSTLIPKKSETSGSIALFDENDEIVITEPIYYEITNYIRECHGFERNWKRPGNEKARQIYIRDAREARQYAGRRQPKSMLEPLVSAMCNHEGFKYDLNTVWDLNIYAFMDATKRIQKIQNANHFMSGMYSGMMDIKKIGKGKLNETLNWLGELK